MKEVLWADDENDKEINKRNKSNIHNSQLWHRGIHIFLFDDKEKIIQNPEIFTR